MKRDGYYAGVTLGSPVGIGGGLYADNQGNFYPQVYFGSPGPGFSVGHTSDVEGLLKGLSVSGNLGGGRVGANLGTSGDPSAFGIGIGTPGAGATYGFGPYNIRDVLDFRPRTDEFGQPFPGNEATTAPPVGYNSGNQGIAPANGNFLSRFLDSFRPSADEFGNPFPEQQSTGGVLKYFGDTPPAPAEPEDSFSVPLSSLDSELDSNAALAVAPDVRRLASRVVRFA
jgi:hypothetical protein